MKSLAEEGPAGGTRRRVGVGGLATLAEATEQPQDSTEGRDEALEEIGREQHECVLRVEHREPQ